MTHATRFVPAVAVLVALVGAPVQAQTPEIGFEPEETDALQAQTPEIDALRARAEQGDARAQSRLGNMYHYGQDIPGCR